MRADEYFRGKLGLLAPVVARRLERALGCAAAALGRQRLPVVAVAVGSLMAAAAGEVAAQMTGLNPTAIEIGQLPKFCWAQMGVPNTMKYAPKNCGPGTNHYCPGLVYLMRAKSEFDMRKRRSMLDRAANDVQYTDQWIASYSKCSIRDHVKSTKAEVEMLRSLFMPAPATAK